MSGNDATGRGNDGSGDRTGTLLSGRYRLEERIGAGGMGEVWRATDTLLSRPVAVKMLHAAQTAEPTARERFRTEARITAALSHPGIAQVYDYGEQDDTAFLVMELVPGEPLSSILKRNDEGLDAGVTLDVLNQAAQALGAAHARGVVHRDIKPGNLLVTEDGTVKLTDFGIARGNESVTLTQTGMVMGTAQYISPEQASGSPATPFSDIYSLGVVAYECLAGRPPFTADTPLALALAHTREEPPPLPGHVPGSVRALVERMLEKSPEDRPASAAEIAQQAQQLRGGLGPAAGGATTAMDLADLDHTMVADLSPHAGDPATRPSGAVSAPLPTGATGPAQAWPPSGAAPSDRLTGTAGPGRAARHSGNRPVLLAAAAALAAVVIGVILIAQFWDSPGENSRSTGGNRPAVSPTPSPTPQESVDDGLVLPGDTGGTEPDTGYGDQGPAVPQQPTTGSSATPSAPATPDPATTGDPVDPVPEDPGDGGQGENPLPGGDGGAGEGTGDGAGNGTGTEQDTGDERGNPPATD
ncbi:protein kinase domain-containing protein [Marinactinospora thermotolerans]|uniref:non-specific serine/threonine protein kinase n=1 Tax=Marinactinospora thermotolerans DSM 45154 TaxID=1122192 RepID=A0A1T4T2T9_9ACTN|nr:serine/threonine-protein kinase [Marinactinospora thermotolerans]SKA34824.1 serine/threonine protein kinase [Marinactinospora thermotolerans DSM 45154]